MREQDVEDGRRAELMVPSDWPEPASSENVGYRSLVSAARIHVFSLDLDEDDLDPVLAQQALRALEDFSRISLDIDPEREALRSRPPPPASSSKVVTWTGTVRMALRF